MLSRASELDRFPDVDEDMRMMIARCNRPRMPLFDKNGAFLLWLLVKLD
jgi:hypothetical protein